MIFTKSIPTCSITLTMVPLISSSGMEASQSTDKSLKIIPKFHSYSTSFRKIHVFINIQCVLRLNIFFSLVDLLSLLPFVCGPTYLILFWYLPFLKTFLNSELPTVHKTVFFCLYSLQHTFSCRIGSRKYSSNSSSIDCKWLMN